MFLDMADFVAQLRAATDALDRELAGALCEELIARLRTGSAEPDAKDMGKILRELRRKRLLELMERVATVYLERFDEHPGLAPVQLQLVQSLIDSGKLLEAKDEVESLIEITSIEDFGGIEARGLLGRIEKQAYVNSRRHAGSSARRHLANATAAYLRVYRHRGSTHWWYGINAVACVARGERDRLDLDELLEQPFDWRSEAQRILETTAGCPVDHEHHTWAMATALEASIALERTAEAHQLAERYIRSPEADVFELASTERQLREVWQLEKRGDPSALVLQVVRGRLGAQGGQLEVEADPGSIAHLALQAQLGDESTKAVNWLEKLCTRTRSVAKIEKDTDALVGGTGFLLAAKDLGSRLGDGVVLLTNSHVVSESGVYGALRPEQASAVFTQLPGAPRARIAKILWSSRDLDATVCALDLSAQPAQGLPVGRAADFDRDDRPPRLYVLGHPRSSALAVSLYDNRLIDRDETHVRYRSPTDRGSSGSPVLSDDLEVVALHHATRTDRLANQGVLLDAIRTALR